MFGTASARSARGADPSLPVGGLSVYGNEAALAMDIMLRLAQLSELLPARDGWESPTGS